MSDTKNSKTTRELRHDQILTAALTVFRANGFSATRMEDIAAETGLSKPAIYLYFDNKETLFKAAIKSVIHLQAPAAERLMAENFDSAEARLSAMLDLLYDGMKPESIGMLVSLISETATQFPDLAEFFRADVFGRVDSLILSAIAAGVETGEFRDTLLSHHVELFHGPALALAMRQSIFQNLPNWQPIDLDAFKIAHFEMLLAHLKPAG